MIEFLVNETDDGPFNESYFRGLVRLAHMHPDQKEAMTGLVAKIDKTSQVNAKVTTALKFVGLCQKLFLYCPDLGTVESFPKLLTFKRLCGGWREVLQKRLADPAKDRFRCEFFINVITHWASNLHLQIELATEFKEFVDSANNVLGITENSEFRAQGSDPQQPGRKTPLQEQFLRRLNRAWRHLAVLNDRILQPPFHLKSIRLQLALVLVEEQHQMMATLAHLFLAFQITIELFKSNLPPQVRPRVAPFISEFRVDFQRNVESFCNLVALVRAQPELRHLAGKLPPE